MSGNDKQNQAGELDESTSEPVVKSEADGQTAELSNTLPGGESSGRLNAEPQKMLSLETSELQFPGFMQSLFVMLRTALFLIVVLGFVTFSPLEILVKLLAIAGTWILLGATNTGSPLKALSFLKKKQASEGSILPVTTISVSGTPKEIFERLICAMRLEKDSCIVEYDPENNQFITEFRARKYGASYERKVLLSVRQQDTKQARIRMEATTRSMDHSFQAKYVVGTAWVDLRLRMFDYKFLDKLGKRILKRLEMEPESLRQLANMKRCQISDCACQSFPEFEHPVNKWGWQFSVKFGLFFLALYQIQVGLSNYLPSLTIPTDFWLYVAIAPIWLQAGLAGIWCVLFRRLFSQLDASSRGEFQTAAWRTLWTPIIFNQAVLPVPLLFGSGLFLVYVLWKIPGSTTVPKLEILCLSISIAVVLAATIAPVLLGGLVYLNLFSRLSSFLKNHGVQTPNPVLSAILVCAALFAPTFVTLWKLDVLLAVALPLIHLSTYLLVFAVLSRYYDAVRNWIHISKLLPGQSHTASAPLQPETAFEKIATSIRSFLRIDSFKFAAAYAAIYIMVGLSNGTFLAPIKQDADQKRYSSTTSRVMIAGERPSGTETILRSTREIHKGHIIEDSDIAEEKAGDEAPIDALFNKQAVVGASALIDIPEGDVLIATDLPFTREQELSLEPERMIPLRSGSHAVEVIIASKPIKKGDMFSPDNTAYIRLEEIQVSPGSVLSQGALVGYVAACDIPYRGLVRNKHVRPAPPEGTNSQPTK